MRNRQVLEPGTTVRTKQSFKDDCDINLIVGRHAQTGMWDHLNPIQPTYGDHSNATDLQTALNLVDQAQEAFDILPARIRAMCLNDPVELARQSSEPDRFAELVKAGLPVTDEVRHELPKEQKSVETPPPATPEAD